MTNKTVTYDSLTHKIVPIEPTIEMIKYAHSKDCVWTWEECRPAYKNMIESAPEYQECSQWVSVDERLPPKSIDVLCQPFLSFSNVAWHDGACWRVTEYIKFFGETHTALEDGFITHWMPLPPAPEGDKP